MKHNKPPIPTEWRTEKDLGCAMAIPILIFIICIGIVSFIIVTME